MHSFVHVTNMIKDDKETLISLIDDMLIKKDEFLKFISLFDNYHGVDIEFYELDSDNYGYDVVSWRIEFKPSFEDKILFRGYYGETFYKLIEKEYNKLEFDGDYFSFIHYINSDKFKELSQEQFEDMYITEIYEKDKFKDWVTGTIDIKMEFKSDCYSG